LRKVARDRLFLARHGDVQPPPPYGDEPPGRVLKQPSECVFRAGQHARTDDRLAQRET
jgi:hypothetical protein